MKRIAIASLLVVSGCSWVVTRAPEPPRRDRPPCAVSAVPAIIDTSQAVSSVLLGLLGLTLLDDDGEVLLLAEGITLGVGALWGASARHGWKQVDACTHQHLRAPVETTASGTAEQRVELGRPGLADR